MKRFFKGFLLLACCLMLYGCAGAADYDIKLPGEYVLVRSSAHYVDIRKVNGASIPKKIIGLWYNDKFILAKQVGLKLRNPDKPDDKYEIPDESKVNFWILQVDNDKVYGPLTEQEFNKKKKELSIPNNIVLKEPSSYIKN